MLSYTHKAFIQDNPSGYQLLNNDSKNLSCFAKVLFFLPLLSFLTNSFNFLFFVKSLTIIINKKKIFYKKILLFFELSILMFLLYDDVLICLIYGAFSKRYSTFDTASCHKKYKIPALNYFRRNNTLFLLLLLQY